MKVYILKSWRVNKFDKNRGEWFNDKVTLSDREADMWIESPFRLMAGEGPDPNADYDVLDLGCPNWDIDDMVAKKANEWIEKVGGTEAEWRKKQITRDFIEGFKLATILYCKKEKDGGEECLKKES